MTESSESKDTSPGQENSGSSLPTEEADGTARLPAFPFGEVHELDTALADRLQEGTAVYMVRVEYEDRPTVERQFEMLCDLRNFLATLIGSRVFVSMSLGIPLRITNTYPPQLWTPVGTIPLRSEDGRVAFSPDGFMGPLDGRPASRGYYPPVAETVEDASGDIDPEDVEGDYDMDHDF